MPDALARRMLEHVPASIVGHACGNALSENVVERILSRLLPAAGLVPDALPDFWRDIQPLPETKAGESKLSLMPPVK